MDIPTHSSESQPSGSWGTKTSQALLSQMNKVQQTTPSELNLKFKPPYPHLTLPSSPAQNKKLKPKPSPKDTDTAPDSQAADGNVSSSLASTQVVTEPTLLPVPVPVVKSIVPKKSRSMYSIMPDISRSGNPSSSTNISKPRIESISTSVNNKPLPQPKAPDNDKDNSHESRTWSLLSRTASFRASTASSPPNVPLPTTPPLIRTLLKTRPHSRIPSSSSYDSFSLLVRDATTPPSRDITSITPDDADNPATATSNPKPRSMSVNLPSSSLSAPITQRQELYPPRPTTAGKQLAPRSDSMPLFLFGSMQAGKLDFQVRDPVNDEKSAETLARVGEKKRGLPSPTTGELLVEEDVREGGLGLDKSLTSEELAKRNADPERAEKELGLKKERGHRGIGAGDGARRWIGNVKTRFGGFKMRILDGVFKLSEKGAGKGLALAVILIGVLTFVLGLLVGLAVGFGAGGLGLMNYDDGGLRIDNGTRVRRPESGAGIDDDDIDDLDDLADSEFDDYVTRKRYSYSREYKLAAITY
ncbi:hypothetical protein BKA65DRAFT_594034 [Rhexocercosporidium sp. MPI-PUGE-AT-0058]|nr:hypothetical protein BKA65DRAFT_594034 [Rhexocercosporidium sp. MPI-PUGE-AT-0058]